MLIRLYYEIIALPLLSRATNPNLKPFMRNGERYEAAAADDDENN